jgi:hypothetical protein
MLELRGSAFTSGRARFSDRPAVGFEPTAKVYVKLHLESLDLTVLAQLDTGSAWSVLAPEIAEALGLLDGKGEAVKLGTRLGTLEGRLVRVPITLLADEGNSLEVEGTFFVSPDWPAGRTFLGYSGLLDSIRIALDPRANDFHFGPPEPA